MGLHLITGGRGYLGSFIARRLVQMGEKVRVLDIAEGPTDVVGEFIQGDIRDEPSVTAAMQDVQYVHHNAAFVPLRKAGKEFWEVNVEGTRTLLKVAKAHQVTHFVHMSSSAVFGNIKASDCPIGDDPEHLHPVEIYGRSKAEAEKIVKDEMMRPGGLSCSIIRPRTIIGKERLGIFQILFEWIAEGRNICIIGDGQNQIQFAHVDDIVDVSIETAMNSTNGFFNIGTDSFGSLFDSLQSLCDEAATGSQIRKIPTWLAIPPLWILDRTRLSPLAPWHYMTYHKPFYFDLSTPLSKLNWRPRMSNTEMLNDAYRWYMHHRETLPQKPLGSAHRSVVGQGLLKALKHFT